MDQAETKAGSEAGTAQPVRASPVALGLLLPQLQAGYSDPLNLPGAALAYRVLLPQARQRSVFLRE
ncbi:MAG: hypothetical protein ORN28_08295 [Rhodoferax sp.]|nr:hypothetical protein [Rhodoferax sp.]